jgi:ELWxxDGT repeat protein
LCGGGRTVAAQVEFFITFAGFGNKKMKRTKMKTITGQTFMLSLCMYAAAGFSQVENCVYNASDVYPGSYGSLPAALTEWNGVLYFSCTGNMNGPELWKYEDGLATMVADICPGIAGSLPNEFTPLGSYLYFSANNGTNGVELFRFDGSTVTLVSDINPGASGSFPNKLTAIGTNLFFFANDGVNGMEPWKFDGTTATLVHDINPGSAGSTGWEIEGFGSYAFFSASNPTYGLELWKYNGSTTSVVDIYPGTTGSDLGELVTLGSKIVFRATNGSIGYELFTHDGTTLTPYDMNPGSADFTPWELTKMGSEVFFRGFQASSGYELWKFNGTTASLVMDIFPGSSNGHPNNLTAVGTNLYFAANNGTVGNELWRYNGTTASLAADIRPGATGSMTVPALEKFSFAGSTVFFLANDGTTGQEVWSYNGTAAELGKDIIPGGGSPSATGLKGMGNILYFQADDGVGGGELWAWNPDAVLEQYLNITTCDDYTSPAGTLYTVPGTYNFVDLIPSVNCPGCDSVITIDLWITDQPASYDTIAVCNSWTSPGGVTYSTAGDYTVTEVVPSMSCPGLDSTINIELTIADGISTAVVVFTNVIVAQQSGAAYQWLDCDNGYAPVAGATEQDFLPVADGNYACEITLGCTDTTNCYFVVGTPPPPSALPESSTSLIRIYPNPVSDFVTIDAAAGDVTATIYDHLGRVVLTGYSDGNQLKMNLAGLAGGTYYIHIRAGETWMVQPLIKE